MGLEMNYRPKYPVQTLEKAIDILLCLRESVSSDGMSIAELSERLDMGKSVVHRLLDTLYAYHFVEKTEKGAGYRLGWGLYDIAQAVPANHNLNESVYRKLMEKLCSEFMETVNLGIYNNGEVVIICKIEPDRRLRSSVEIGEREPLYATALGKQFLAAWSKEEVQQYFRSMQIEALTERTIVDPEEMERELQRVKRQGYSVDDMEYCDGLICTAVPIYNFRNHIVAAMSISVPESRYSKERGMEIVAALQEAAVTLSEFLGYQNQER